MVSIPNQLATKGFTGWFITTDGASDCTSLPSSITTIRSESLSASDWSWVTRIAAVPVSWMVLSRSSTMD